MGSGRFSSVKKYKNLSFISLPPYSTGLNPTKSIQSYIHSYIANNVYNDIDSLIDQLVIAHDYLFSNKDFVKVQTYYKWIRDFISTN